MHNLIFKSDARRQQQHLQSSPRFGFQISDIEFDTKLAKIIADFSQIQLNSVTNLLHLYIQGFEADIAQCILQKWTDLDAFQKAMNTHTDSELETEIDDANSPKIIARIISVSIPEVTIIKNAPPSS